MKKRILSMLLALLMVVTIIPISVTAAEEESNISIQENANQSDGIVLRKSAQINANGSVDVTIEAYTTGTVTQSTVTKPTDIVLVLDVSGSMETTVATTAYTYAAVNGTRERSFGRYYYGNFNTNNTKYYINLGTTSSPDYREVTRVNYDSNRYYYFQYYNNNNQAVYVYPVMNNSNYDDQANSYPIVQFYREQIDNSKTVYAIDALKTAVTAFVETTRVKNAEIAAQGGTADMMHRIAIVKFASSDFYNDSNLLAEGNHRGANNDNRYNYTELVKNLTVVQDAAGAQNATALKNAVTALTSGGATAVDYGMDIAEAVLEQTPSNRNKVVIVFSDGEPTHSNSFSTSVASSAIGVANGLKLSNTKIYSVSMASGSNPSDTTQNINKFFHYISSNYPSAQNMNTPGANGNPNAGYYYAPTFDLSLTSIFESIAQQIETPSISLDETTQIIDTVSPYFTLQDGANSIRIQTADRIKDGDNWDWATPVSANLTPIVTGKTLQVQGFDFDENFVSDTPRAKGSNANYYGTKLLLTINVLPDYAAIDANPNGGLLITNSGNATVMTANGVAARVASPTIQLDTVKYTYTVNGTNETLYATYYRLPNASVRRLNNITRPGYTFSGWSLSYPSNLSIDGSGNFTMPDSNVVFTGNFAANTHNVTYTISGYNPGVTVPANYNQTGVAFDSTVTVMPDLSFAGYTFMGWKSDSPVVGERDTIFKMPNHDVKLYGYFEPMSGIPYQTIHYTENLDGTYSRAEAPIIGAGTTGEAVSAAVRTYAGFTRDDSVTNAVVTGEGTFNAKVSGSIAGDGSLILRVFHKRNRYTVTYAYDGSYPASANAVLPQAETYLYGETVNVKAHTQQDAILDHTFTGWHTAPGAAVTVRDADTSFVMPIGDVTLWGEFAKKADIPFKIEHYQQDGTGWRLAVTDTSHGTAGTTVYAANYRRTFTGYTYNAAVAGSVTQGIISESPMLVLKLYYTLNTYSVTYQLEDPTLGVTIPNSYNTTEKFGTNVTVQDSLSAPAGYTFSGWEIKSPTSVVISGAGTFTMPADNVVLVGSFIPNNNVTFKIEYYWQNPDPQNDGYTLHETATYTGGVTGAVIDVETTHSQYKKTYSGMTYVKLEEKSVTSGTVAGDGSLVLKLYYNRNTYGVRYNYEDGVPGNAPDLPLDSTAYRYGQTVNIKDDRNLVHYEFIGWYSKSDVAVTGDTVSFEMPIPENNAFVNLYGDFRQITGVTFRVHHYLQNAVGSNAYTRVETDTITTGVAGEMATGRWNNYAGYKRNEIKSAPTLSGIITADDSLELHLYYDLLEYDITYVIDGENPGVSVPTGGKAVYGQAVTIAPDPSYTDYTFKGWTSTDPAITEDQATFIMPAQNVTLVGKFSKYPTYKVEYYLQNKNDLTKYDLDPVTSHSHSAPAGAIVEAYVHVYDGYKQIGSSASVLSGTVTADSSLVLRVYYNLIPYTVSYQYEGTVPQSAPALTSATRYVDDVVFTPAVAVAGYSFDGWRSEQLTADVTPGQSFTMPAHDVVMIGMFTAGNARYTVEHYLMNDSGNYNGVVPYRETKTALVDTTVRAEVYQPYLDMEALLDFAQIQLVNQFTGKVAADNSLVLKLFYSRNPVATVVYHYEGTPEEIATWPALPTDSNRYYVGATVTAQATAQPSNVYLTFEGWYSHEPQLHVEPNDTFAMPRLDDADPVLHLYGRWIDNAPKRFTVKYFIDNVEQTEWTVNYTVGTEAVLRAKVADTAQYSYTAWSAPVSATEGVAVVMTAGGFTMNAPGEIHIKCTSQPIIIPAETYTVTYYLDGVKYWSQDYEAGQQHTMLGMPALAYGQIFSGWSTPRTISGGTVALFRLANGQTAFIMPADDVIIHATTGWISVIEGSVKIRKVVEAPEDFTGSNVYTFNIYRLNGSVKTLVHVESVEVNPLTGKGESKYISLPLGTNYVVEEVGANVPGYTLETVIRTENNTVIESGTSLRFPISFVPSIISFTNTYTEIPLETADHIGYIIGYPDGTVRPEGNITRAEVATIFFRLLTDEKRAEYWAQTNSFTDVSADAWYNNAISTLANAGVLEGYGDGTFRPGSEITRAELVKIAMSFYGKIDANSGYFNDTDGHWASAFINAAAELGFIEGYGDGTFQPNRLVTRAEAMKIINRTLDRKPDKDHLLPDMIIWEDNANPDVWYYADVQEATNSHTYTDGGLYEIWETILPIRDWADLEKSWSDAYDGHN